MLRLLRHLLRQPVQIKIVPRDPMRLTMDEWRSQKDLVKSAREELRNPVVRQMLDVMRTSHLSRYTESGSAEAKAFHLCRCEGYKAAMDDFEALATPKDLEEPLESTFEPAEEQQL